MTTQTITTSVAGFTLGASVTLLEVTTTGTIGNPGLAMNTAAVVENSGHILGTGAANGIIASAGGVFDNYAGAIISGYSGLHITGAAATVTNSGSITGAGGFGVGLYLGAGGSVTNSGVISGSSSGVASAAAATIANRGTINGAGNDGVSLKSGGMVVNGASAGVSALISGLIGVYAGTGGAATVTTYGTIQGTGGTAVKLGDSNDRLIDEAGAVFVGSVTGGAGTMEFAAGGGAGTVSGLGTVFSGFSEYLIDSGAAWTMTGSNYMPSGVVIDRGTLNVASNLINNDLLVYGLLDNEATMTGVHPTIRSGGTIDNHGTLTISASISANAITASAGGVIDNYAGAYVIGASGVHITGAAGTVINSGLIDGVASSGDGVYLQFGGAVINGSATARGALIQGGDGVSSAGSGPMTVTNFGLIEGTAGTAVKFASSADRLIVEGGSAFEGAVFGDGGVLELAAAGGGGVLLGLGTSVSGFANVLVDAGATWRVSGAVDLYGGAMYVAGTLTSYGSIVNHTGGAGVTLGAGGRLINGPAGLISGGFGVFSSAIGAGVVNFGTILAPAADGLLLDAGGSATNGSSSDTGALIQGYRGVYVTGGAATLSNFGTVRGTISDGVHIGDGGVLANGSLKDKAALIYGYSGVFTPGVAATVVNFATIEGFARYGDGAFMAGGVLTNGTTSDTGALIEGVNSGVSVIGIASVANFGVIEGVYGEGVDLIGGGVLTNGSATDLSAFVQGGTGVHFGAPGTVSNFGTIVGLSGPGARLEQGGTLINGFGLDRTAIIEGLTGVEVDAGAANVVNVATIEGLGATAGVVFAAGGTLANGSATDAVALIEGYDGLVQSAGTATNFGTLLGVGLAGRGGADLSGSALLTNGSATHLSATIDGNAGVTASGTATLVNFGTVVGEGGTAVQFASTGDVLAVEAGATFIGSVVGGGGTLDLAGGTGTVTSLLVGGNVTETGSTSTFTNFGALEIGPGASFVAAGSPTIAAGQGLIVAGTLNEAGTLTSAGKLTVGGTLAGTGTLALTGGASTFNTGAGLTIAKVTESGAATTASFAANLNIADLWTQTGGTMTVATGDRINFLATGDSFAGTLTGAGVIAFAGGTDTLTGATLSGSAMVISGGAVTLLGPINLTKTLTVTSPNLTIAAGGATLSGGGILYLNSAATSAVIGASAAATLTNKEVIEGAGQLGDGQLSIVNAAGGIIAGFLTTGLTINAGAGSLSNAGLIENTNTGGTTITGAVSNTGTLLVSKGVLTVDGAVSGAGIVRIAGGTADFASTFTENVTFTGTTGVLELAHSQTYTGAIGGLSTSAGGSTLDLLDITFASGSTKATYSGTTTSGTLTVTDGTHTAKITLIGNYVGHTFTTASDGHGGTTVADPAPSGTGHVIPLTPLVTAMATFGGGAARTAAVPIGPRTNFGILAAPA